MWVRPRVPTGPCRWWALEIGRVGCSAQQAARLTHAHTPPLSTPVSHSWEEDTEAGGVRPSQGHPAMGHLLFDLCAWHLPGGCSGVGPGPRSSQAASPQARPSCSADLTRPPAVGSPGPLTSRVSVTDQGCVLWAISHPRPTLAHHQTQLWFSQERGPPTRGLDQWLKHLPQGDPGKIQPSLGGCWLLWERAVIPASSQRSEVRGCGLCLEVGMGGCSPNPPRCVSAEPGWEEGAE